MSNNRGYTIEEWVRDIVGIVASFFKGFKDHPFLLGIMCAVITGFIVVSVENSIKTSEQTRMYKEMEGKEQCYRCSELFVYKDFTWVMVKDSTCSCWVYICPKCKTAGRGSARVVGNGL